MRKNFIGSIPVIVTALILALSMSLTPWHPQSAPVCRETRNGEEYRTFQEFGTMRQAAQVLTTESPGLDMLLRRWESEIFRGKAF